MKDTRHILATSLEQLFPLLVLNASAVVLARLPREKRTEDIGAKVLRFVIALLAITSILLLSNILHLRTRLDFCGIEESGK